MKKNKWYKVFFYTDNPEEAAKRLLNGSGFKGKISQFKVYKTFKTKKEVLKDYLKEKEVK